MTGDNGSDELFELVVKILILTMMMMMTTTMMIDDDDDVSIYVDLK